MRKYIYCCNECGKEIRENVVSFKGIVREGEPIWDINQRGGYWNVSFDGKPFVGHYCNYECLSKHLIKISKECVVNKMASHTDSGDTLRLYNKWK